jgi:fatty acid desaturase
VLGLTLFPLGQIGLFGLACFFVSSRPYWAAACLLGASLVHTFAIHVFVHEVLHYSDRRPLPRILDFPVTAIVGLPFDAYRLHHHNHHRFVNGEEDYSRTWRMTPEGPAPYGLVRYALGWPLQAMRAGRHLRSLTLAGPEEKAFRRTGLQKAAIAALVLVLGVFSWKWALMYLVMIYLGWALVSVHNYGQHPPEARADIPSFQGSWYNRLLFNNGLHYEHHAEPAKAWYELEPDPRAARIGRSHFTAGLVRGVRDLW